MFACVTVHKLKTASYTTDLSVWVIRISLSNISFVMLWCLWSRKIVFSLQLLRVTWRWLHLQWKQGYKALRYKCGTLLSCVVCSDNFGDFDVPRAKHCKNHSTESTHRHFINHSKAEKKTPRTRFLKESSVRPCGDKWHRRQWKDTWRIQIAQRQRG